MRVMRGAFNLFKEEYLKPYIFKGDSVNGKWIAKTAITDESGVEGAAVGGFAVLWSDPGVYNSHTEMGGNIMMAACLEKAVNTIVNREYTHVEEAMDDVFERVFNYGKLITENEGLNKTFVLNSMVSLDLALWVLWKKLNSMGNFKEVFEEKLNTKAVCANQVAVSPVVAKNTGDEEIESLLKEGFFVLKCKMGSGCAEDDAALFLRADNIGRNYSTSMTESGHISYVLDLNGRYKDKDKLKQLLDIIDKKSDLGKILTVEEPFEKPIDVSEFPVIITADESVFDKDSVDLASQMGYGGVAVKPAGKTLTKSFEMTLAAFANGMHTFVADNSATPEILEPNRNFASLLPPFPGLKVPLIEVNGFQLYKRWDFLVEEHERKYGSRGKPVGGMLVQDEEYFKTSGGLFDVTAKDFMG